MGYNPKYFSQTSTNKIIDLLNKEDIKQKFRNHLQQELGRRVMNDIEGKRRKARRKSLRAMIVKKVINQYNKRAFESELKKHKLWSYLEQKISGISQAKAEGVEETEMVLAQAGPRKRSGY